MPCHAMPYDAAISCNPPANKHICTKRSDDSPALYIHPPSLSSHHSCNEKKRPFFLIPLLPPIISVYYIPHTASSSSFQTPPSNRHPLIQLNNIIINSRRIIVIIITTHIDILRQQFIRHPILLHHIVKRASARGDGAEQEAEDAATEGAHGFARCARSGAG